MSALISSYKFNLLYAHELVADVKEELMTYSPHPGLENHPAFTLGHLCSAAALTIKYLGKPYEFPENWEEVFRRKGPGDPRLPLDQASAYPTKRELLEKLRHYHQQVEELILELSEEQLKEEVKWRFSNYFPHREDLLYFMCVSHEAMHLGQLAAWRRALQLPSALARL